MRRDGHPLPRVAKDQLGGTALPGLGPSSTEVPSASQITLRREADVNMLIQPCLVLFHQKLQYASDLRILDFSLRKEIHDLSEE